MLQEGQQQKIIIAGISKTATVKEVTHYQNGNVSGYSVVYDVPGYGVTQPFWYDSNTSYAELHRSRSGMPKEYVYKRGKDFKHNL